MKITFLGTGTSQGVPVIACPCRVCSSADPRDKRLRASVMIEDKGKVIVIDSGPDFRQQMLRANVKHLDGLVFTHEHKDHIAGMDDIRAFNYVHKKKVDVYASEKVQETMKREFPYVFEDFKYPGVPEIDLHTISNKEFEVAGIKILPVEVMHYRIPVFGFRIGDFTYITDANFISEEEKKKIRGSKIIVLNALRKEKHVSHYNLEEAVSVLKDLNPETGYLTHISHQLGLHVEVEKELPENIKCAYDGLVLNL
ncbi:MAG TPA: MBL fold metallo-hydrolase [Bacteroidia bacterium]|nr:MBL fold metallo-hydrolase [Bacteroidia bacterium]